MKIFVEIDLNKLMMRGTKLNLTINLFGWILDINIFLLFAFIVA